MYCIKLQTTKAQKSNKIFCNFSSIACTSQHKISAPAKRNIVPQMCPLHRNGIFVCGTILRLAGAHVLCEVCAMLENNAKYFIRFLSFCCLHFNAVHRWLGFFKWIFFDRFWPNKHSLKSCADKHLAELLAVFFNTINKKEKCLAVETEAKSNEAEAHCFFGSFGGSRAVFIGFLLGCFLGRCSASIFCLASSFALFCVTFSFCIYCVQKHRVLFGSVLWARAMLARCFEHEK